MKERMSTALRLIIFAFVLLPVYAIFVLDYSLKNALTVQEIFYVIPLIILRFVIFGKTYQK
tara:strand:- start:34 stop:216 length:183 start_codon:yes stop_codon:yes gene_type:complete